MGPPPTPPPPPPPPTALKLKPYVTFVNWGECDFCDHWCYLYFCVPGVGWQEGGGGGNKTFHPQDVSPPSRFAPLVNLPPNPSGFAPKPFHPIFLFLYKRFINSMWDREKGREREEHVLWMKMLIRNYDKYYLFWSILLITLFIWFDSLITQLMRLMMRCENTCSLQSLTPLIIA